MDSVGICDSSVYGTNGANRRRLCREYGDDWTHRIESTLRGRWKPWTNGSHRVLANGVDRV